MTIEVMEKVSVEEDTVESTKWTAYVDSFASHPTTGVDSKVHLLMKPVCLQRNVRTLRKFHTARYYPPEISKMFGLQEMEEVDIKPVISPCGTARMPTSRRQSQEASGSKILLTLNPVTPEEAEELEKQLERNQKRRSEKAQKELEAAMFGTNTSASIPGQKLTHTITKPFLVGTNNPITPEEAERLEKQLEANAKRRAEIANLPKSPYIIKENLQCRFLPNSYKMMYVQNTENFFYHKGSLKRAKENHKVVSNKTNEVFGKWHQAWLEENVTAEQIMRCEDWLLTSKNFETKIVSSNDINLTPYHPFNRYIVVRKESKS